jgi:hypothetical protein
LSKGSVPLSYLPLCTEKRGGWTEKRDYIQPQSREGERRDSENFSALSAGAYTTTWLVSSPVAVSKIVRHGNKKTIFLVMVYSALFDNVCKEINLF